VSAVTEPAEGAVHALHRDARGRAVLETWLVPAMGHAWSGGDPRGTHTYPPGPPATERMLDFLLGPGAPGPGR
jgi:poly(3-hydroxybutyrate) depolymerase